MSAPNSEKLEPPLKNATIPKPRGVSAPVLKKHNSELTKTSSTPPSADTPGSALQTTEQSRPTSKEDEPNNSPFFKAVGVIQGEVNLGENNTNSVTINGKKYPLRYAAEKHKTLLALKLEIKNTGNTFQRLIVYPRVIHFPRREQPQVMYFELVGFEGASAQNQGLMNELNELEFKLSGLWQFIPVCQVPCVSIFRNFTEERKLFIKQAEPYVKIRFMKANHLPLFWKDSPVRPFRFNPRLDKDQGRPMFVQVKAKFIPERNQFEFIEELAQPLAESPRFLKVSKLDKTEQLKNVAASKSLNPTNKEPGPKPKPKLIRPLKQ